MRKQHGVSLTGLIVTLAVLGFVGIMGAKLLPSYVEYWSVRKIFKAMEQNGEIGRNPLEIRKAYDLRNAIEDVRNVQGKDLEIANQDGQTVVSAEWSVKIPMVFNISACLDFYATTGPESASSSDSAQ